MQKSHKSMRGFEYLMYSSFSSCLLIVLLLLPLAPVFASESVEAATQNDSPREVDSNEDHDTDDSQTGNSNVISVDESSASRADEGEVTSGDSQGVVSLEQVSGDTSPAIELPTDSQVVSSEDLADVTLDNVNTDTQVQDNEIEEAVSDSNIDTVPDTVPLLVEGEEEASTTIEVIELPTDEATTTIPVPEEELLTELDTMVEQQPVSTTTQATATPIQSALPESPLSEITMGESSFTFSKDECVSVGEGSFYCSNATSTPASIGIDRVFSASDEDGDREIFVEKDKTLTQVSRNLFEDDAPYFDEVSDTIVWHRLIDGRYQIISYDTESGEETQITHDRYNNMEASRYGDLTVWQGWVGNDWEVMLDERGELSMITDNATQDVSPRINGNYVIWQSFEEGAWRVKVYDRLTKQMETISDAEGASVDNPRFVLVYDTKHENGDVETKGYDLESGEVTPLTAVPAPIPETIPDPEQTGEKRALVTPQIQPKTKAEGDTDDDTLDPENPDIEEGDLVIPSLITGESSSTLSINEVYSELDDLVLPVNLEESTTSVDHILDVIITPYVEPITPADTNGENLDVP